jgi:hypothetical protein
MARFESFEKIVNKAEAKNVYERNAKASLNWFRREVGRMTGATEMKMIKSPDLKPVARALKGRMYMYGYDPKHKDTLPYYDTFPLIIMVGPAKGGFYGLNLHYLDLKRRALLFDALSTKFLKPNANDELERFMLSFEKLSAGGNLKFFQPCWKHYLTKQVKTRIIQVPSDYWEPALFLPTDSFQKKGRRSVWRESKRIATR